MGKQKQQPSQKARPPSNRGKPPKSDTMMATSGLRASNQKKLATTASGKYIYGSSSKQIEMFVGDSYKEKSRFRKNDKSNDRLPDFINIQSNRMLEKDTSALSLNSQDSQK